MVLFKAFMIHYVHEVVIGVDKPLKQTRYQSINIRFQLHDFLSKICSQVFHLIEILIKKRTSDLFNWIICVIASFYHPLYHVSYLEFQIALLSFIDRRKSLERFKPKFWIRITGVLDQDLNIGGEILFQGRWHCKNTQI